MTTMRLSEAIRLGAMLKPQKFTSPKGQLKHETHTCALAAAAEAAGQANLSVYAPHWLWPWATVAGTKKQKRRRPCPVCGYEWLGSSCCDIAVIHVITHLNDVHHWTRERIADWVETLEPPVSQATASPDRSVALDPVVLMGTEGSTRA